MMETTDEPVNARMQSRPEGAIDSAINMSVDDPDDWMAGITNDANVQEVLALIEEAARCVG